MTAGQAIREAVGRRGLTGAELERRRVMAASTYSRKRRRPGTFTLADLQRIDKIVRFTDDELRAMIRGR